MAQLRKAGAAALLLFAACCLLLQQQAAAADADEWRQQVIYFLLTDRFAPSPGVKPGTCALHDWNNGRCSSSNSSSSPENTPAMEAPLANHLPLLLQTAGTWRGITDNLDLLQDMGMTAVSAGTSKQPGHTVQFDRTAQAAIQIGSVLSYASDLCRCGLHRSHTSSVARPSGRLPITVRCWTRAQLQLCWTCARLVLPPTALSQTQPWRVKQQDTLTHKHSSPSHTCMLPAAACH
jgi:hypothetical protein